MRRIICCMSLLITGIYTLYAQFHYYSETKTFKGDGYEYQCDVFCKYDVTLYNKEDYYSDDDIVYKATGEPFSSPFWEGKRGLSVVEPASEMLQEARRIVSSAFTMDEAKKLGENKMIISLYIDSDKGNVLGVHFNFLNINAYANVPISKYREIEVKIKENIHFTPTDLGRQLKVIMICWSQKPTGLWELKDPGGEVFPMP